MKAEIISWIKSIAIAIVIAFIITLFIRPTQVYSISMNPTLFEHDLLIVLRGHDVEQGDIVSFKSHLELTDYEKKQLNFIEKFKAGKYKNLIKRVIAVEGDELIIEDGKVIVNGEELKEDYIKESGTNGNIRINKIPEGKVFVMGDNRDHSLDSRSNQVGLVDKDDIDGKVVFRVFPFKKIGTVK